MNKLKSLLTFGLLMTVMVTYGCQDLGVENTNNPDTERALANAGDIEALVSNQYMQWWNGTQKNYPGMTLSVIAQEMTSSWGNFGMNDLGQLPRQGFINSPSYADRFMSSTPWANMYTAISAANDGLVALNEGLTLSPAVNTERMRAYAKFIQGISYGYLANHFDKAFLVDEETQLIDDGGTAVQLDFMPYDEVLDFAVEKLEAAKAVAEAHSFTLPTSWIRGNELTSADFVKLINSHLARIISQNARSVSERDALDWNEIKTLAENGIEEDFIVSADGVLWWSRQHSLMQDPTWMRASYFLIGRTDESGRFEDWRTTAPNDRREFRLETADARIAGQEDVIILNDDEEPVDTLEAGIRAEGSDFRWVGPSAFNAARGYYVFSQYMYHRSDEMYRNGFVGPMPHMRRAEMDGYIAEALLRGGSAADLPEVVELINKTRVDRGGLEPVTILDSADDLWNAMRYEFEIETAASAAGLAYYHKRSWGNLKGKDWGRLETGSPIHFPVPAGELDLLELDHYTFGGPDGEGAAPRVGNPTIDSALDAGDKLDIRRER